MEIGLRIPRAFELPNGETARVQRQQAQGQSRANYGGYAVSAFYSVAAVKEHEKQHILCKKSQK
jgi:hypothetical protein